NEQLASDGNIVNIPVKLDFKTEELSKEAKDQSDAITDAFFNTQKSKGLSQKSIGILTDYYDKIGVARQNALQNAMSGNASPEQMKELEKFAEQLGAFEQLGGQLQNTLSGAFEGALTNGEDFFQSVVDGFKKMLAQMAAQLAASAVIKVLAMII